jgi:hypothetical protein
MSLLLGTLHSFLRVAGKLVHAQTCPESVKLTIVNRVSVNKFRNYYRF